MWARTESGTDKDITLRTQKGSDPWTQYNKEVFTIDGEWKEYSMTWTQTDALNDAWVMIHIPGSDLRVALGKLWVDHVRVYEGGYAADAIAEAMATPSAAQPAGRLATSWGHVKSHRY